MKRSGCVPPEPAWGTCHVKFDFSGATEQVWQDALADSTSG